MIFFLFTPISFSAFAQQLPSDSTGLQITADSTSQEGMVSYSIKNGVIAQTSFSIGADSTAANVAIVKISPKKFDKRKNREIILASVQENLGIQSPEELRRYAYDETTGKYTMVYVYPKSKFEKKSE